MVFCTFLINRITRFWNSSDGVISIIWGLVLPVVIGFLALGIEVSMWYTRKNDLQSATDAGAVATARIAQAMTQMNGWLSCWFSRDTRQDRA